MGKLNLEEMVTVPNDNVSKAVVILIYEFEMSLLLLLVSERLIKIATKEPLFLFA